jgi:predicted nucleic-acid-binding protein
LNGTNNRPAAYAASVPTRDEQLSVQDSEMVEAAVAQYRHQQKVGFSDCLMVEVARTAGHKPLGTFDLALGRLDGAHRLT